nr:MAG TPA: hypothetical protein [Caudoviricetes sp.]
MEVLLIPIKMPFTPREILGFFISSKLYRM